MWTTKYLLTFTASRGWRLAAVFVDEDRFNFLQQRPPNVFDTKVGEMTTDASILVYESEHPYPDSENKTYEVSIPGAEAIGIAFTMETTTERGCDYIQFLKTEDGSETFSDPFSGGRGGSERNFPGVNDIPPFVIPSDRFWVKFVSDG